MDSNLFKGTLISVSGLFVSLRLKVEALGLIFFSASRVSYS